MSKIKIKHFGPVQEGYTNNDGWMDIKKVTVIIGNQGSGKSTVAKLISTLTWIEKSLFRGDHDVKWYEKKGRLEEQFLKYHRIENYLKSNGSPKSIIEYQGEACTISYKAGTLSIRETSPTSYPLPQIMYVPAERNFITYVKTPKELKLSSDSLQEFLTEFENAKQDTKTSVKLPINDVNIEYNKINDSINLKGKDYKIRLNEASSGFQSLVPLYIVSRYLANSVKRQSDSNQEPMSSEEKERFKKGVKDIYDNPNLTFEQKRDAISALSLRFNKSAFINIVEEPEQNLFPSSQWQMLKSLLEFNNMNAGNKLIITTHSPYIINFLSIAIQAAYLKNKIMQAKGEAGLLDRLYRIVPERSMPAAEDVIVYELEEETGTITRLPAQNGIPSDNNYLNKMLAEGNTIFDSLLEIEQEL
jgi:predicted ATPase